MGLTIYYNGTFKKTASLPEMIEEVKDIATVHQWKYHVFEKEFPRNSLGKKNFNKDIYGILFSPPMCEPVLFCFLSNGKMANPFMMEFWLKSKKKKDKDLLFGNFTKTQYAGVEVHIIIIGLFRYLSKKYLKNFSMIDEGKFWETNDEELLRKTFKEWSALIDGFANTLETIKIKKGESIEGTIRRAAKIVHTKRKKS